MPLLCDLHLAAAQAKRNGKLEMAASLLEIAEAAERLLAGRAAPSVGLAYPRPQG
jgi:hypothetical protein